MSALKGNKKPPRKVRSTNKPFEVDSDFEPVDFSSVEWIDLDQIRINENNPRIHTEKNGHALARAIQSSRVCTPLIIDDENRLLAGHGRLMALRLLRLKKAPCLRTSKLGEAQKRLFAIADNKTHDLSTFDPQLLAVEIKEIIELKSDIWIGDIGFEMAEIDIMLDSLKEPVVAASVDKADPADAVPDALSQTVTRPGDVWLCGSSRVICGNSLAAVTYDRLLQGVMVDLVVQDSPFNVSVKKHVGGLGRIQHREFAMASGEMSKPEFSTFLQDQFALVAQHSRPGAVIASFMDWRSIAPLVMAGEAVALELINMIVWNKTNASMGSLWRSKYELIAMFKKPGAPATNNVQLGKFGRYRTNVWDAPGANSFGKNRMQELGSHPTPKNVAMIADAIRDVTHRGERVLDNFLGSGTLLIAAERTERIAYGIEIDPVYVDVSVRRWQEFTGRRAVLEASGKTFEEMMAERSSPSPIICPPPRRRATAA